MFEIYICAIGTVGIQGEPNILSIF